MIDERPGWFVKQAPPDETSALLLTVEASLYQLAARAPAEFPPAPWMPRLVLWDPADAILITELFAHAVDEAIAEDAQAHPVTRGLGPAVGAALAATHRVRPGSLGPEGPCLPTTPPWVLDIGRPIPDHLRSLSEAQLALLRAIQRDARVRNTLDALAEGWTPTALVHGDIKWANLLLAGDRPAGPPLRMVDWELTQWGDPLWDLGGALTTYLSDVLGMLWTDAVDAEAAAGMFASALPALQQEVGQVWTAYWAGSEHGREAAVQTVRYGAARLLQTAFEWSATEDQMPRGAVAACQLGLNLLTDPQGGASSVFGLEIGTCR